MKPLTLTRMGRLQINLIRGNLFISGVSNLGRKANSYVKITYDDGSINYISKVVQRGGILPLWNETFPAFTLKKGISSISSYNFKYNEFNLVVSYKYVSFYFSIYLLSTSRCLTVLIV